MSPHFTISLLAAAAFLALPLPAGGQETDTLEATADARFLIRNHYGYRSVRGSFVVRGNPRGGPPDLACDGGAGQLCHGGDPDRGVCPVNALCQRTEEFLAGGLMELALEHPTSGFITGQAVYALAKFGYHTDVHEVVEACRAEPWWCSALRGYAAYARGRLPRAEVHFREAMTWDAPLLRCRWGDAFWLLGEWSRNTRNMGDQVPDPPEARLRTRDRPCMERLPPSDTLFWWGDPLLGDAINDRWTVHIARSMEAWFYEEIQEVRWGAEIPERYREYDWASRVRRGAWDSYSITRGVYTSQEAAAYRFLPLVEADDFSDPVWELEATILTEGYTPESGPFHTLPVQLARFRRGDSLRLAASGDLGATPLRRVAGAEVHLVLTDAPRSFPLRADTAVRRREIPRFLETAPSREYMLGLEAMTELGVGWHRSFLSPLAVSGPEISDLLLFDPSLQREPEGLEGAAAVMLASKEVGEGGEAGVFWEVYGTPARGELAFEMTLEREEGGLVDRLVGVLPGGSREGRGRVAWTEPAVPTLHPRAITLALGGLDPGDYTLILKVSWEGQDPLERRRSLTIS